MNRYNCSENQFGDFQNSFNRYRPCIQPCCSGCCCNIECPLPVPQNPPGSFLGYADFYALMPPDNSESIAPGEDVEFPEQSFIGGTSIGRATDSSFNLFDAGTYLVLFEATVDASAQLVLTLNGTELSYTLVGRNVGGSQISGMAIVNATEDSVLTVRNPASANSPVVITPTGGGELSISAHLIIIRLQ